MEDFLSLFLVPSATRYVFIPDWWASGFFLSLLFTGRATVKNHICICRVVFSGQIPGMRLWGPRVTAYATCLDVAKSPSMFIPRSVTAWDSTASEWTVELWDFRQFDKRQVTVRGTLTSVPLIAWGCFMFRSRWPFFLLCTLCSRLLPIFLLGFRSSQFQRSLYMSLLYLWYGLRIFPSPPVCHLSLDFVYDVFWKGLFFGEGKTQEEKSHGHFLRISGHFCHFPGQENSPN